MVEDYAKLWLTDGIDIFPATSGLAKQFQQTAQSQYLTGLWRNDFLGGLVAFRRCPPRLS